MPMMVILEYYYQLSCVRTSLENLKFLTIRTIDKTENNPDGYSITDVTQLYI